jgi:hypothetical protein
LFLPKARGATHQASFVSAKGGESECDCVDVSVTTLDAHFAGRARGPDFIKIDVEGHEQNVLRGGLDTLHRHRPTLLIECESRHNPSSSIDEVFLLLRRMGYHGSFFHRGGRRPIEEFRGDEHQPQFPEIESPPRGYVNNFAFEHPGRAG